MRSPDRGGVRGRGAFPGRPRRAADAALAALALAAWGCAARAPRRPATAAEAAAIVSRWEGFREAVLARPAAELFYDARARRALFSTSGVAAVRDEPGRSLTVVLEGPAGVPLARASWDGARTVVRRAGSPREEREFEGDDPLTPLGIPLSAPSLSLLLFGLPDASPPERVEFSGGTPWLSWRGGALSCELDPSGRARRVVAVDANRKVEVRFSEWSGGIPSRIRIDVSTGGRADLALRADAGGES